MKAALVARDYLQADETPIRYLDPDVKGKSQQGWLWTYSQPEGDVVFEWHIRRSREGPREFRKEFKGKLQTDGYGVYESVGWQGSREVQADGRWGFHFLARKSTRRHRLGHLPGNGQRKWLRGLLKSAERGWSSFGWGFQPSCKNRIGMIQKAEYYLSSPKFLRDNKAIRNPVLKNRLHRLRLAAATVLALLVNQGTAANYYGS